LIDDPMMDKVLSLRADERWPEMIKLIGGLPADVRDEQPFQRQLALALNRDGRSLEAERILLRWVDDGIADSKTLGILGRVYRDRWELALERGDAVAGSHLAQAIEMYSRGFDESERQNSYPGINLLTLFVISNPNDPHIPELADEIRDLVAPKLEGPSPDYFDYATELELSVDMLEEHPARSALKGALETAGESKKPGAHPRKRWALRTTAHNLSLLRIARKTRGESYPWATEIEHRLLAEADQARVATL